MLNNESCNSRAPASRRYPSGAPYRRKFGKEKKIDLKMFDCNACPYIRRYVRNTCTCSSVCQYLGK